MSTALQPAAHQPVALASSPMPPPSGRHAPASPSSRRPPSRKASGHGASPSLDLNSSRPPRAAPTKAQHPERRSSKSERPSTMIPVAPPRTSSAQPGGSSRRSHQESIEAAGGLRSDSRVDASAPPQNHKSKRPGNHSSHDSAVRPTSSRAAEVSMPIRSAAKPREATEGLAAMVPSNEGLNGREARASYHASSAQNDAAPPPVVSPSGAPEERRATRSRHDHSRSLKGTSKFGDFILGNTIGEGEFGKVKLGWKQDSSVQVAIKLIKRDTVGGNPSRLSKIRREVTILRGLQHPNIVRLIDMIETDRYIGIILEYASGGELFDYILNHRYLKDHSARRLFSQLVSGVGYLHKKGIVHRDLKLENLLLDRNRNIIITDFGFANTFDPHDELAEEEELSLTDRDFVKRIGLDKVKPSGSRKGDLMQTSCGSPCYAAPELVVSDSLYTGRKVDVWSCGVILYAMLAGYLPFDDDPANPEGDNINLLYKYIVSTPLTFPEYVTPHARDLLRRILVPNPRKRADLFEVARHSWLSEYAHVVEFITSTTTSPSEAQSASAHHGYAERSTVARSASVREAAKHKSPAPAAVGGLVKAHAKIDQDIEQAYRTPKDTKRRTVQVEYVAPITQTQRGSDPSASGTQASRDYEDGHHDSPPRRKPLAQGPAAQPRMTQSSHGNAGPARGSRDMRATSDNPQLASAGARPQTGGSLQSAASMGLQSRGNYGQPAPPTIADTNVQGRIQQPSNAEDDEASGIGRPSVVAPSKFARMSGLHESRSNENKGHKRSSTIGDIGSRLLGRSGSVFGGKSRKRSEQQQAEKAKKYPPVSMSNAIPQGEDAGPRPSIESNSRRSFSLGIAKKRSGSMTGSQESSEKKERRRFSLLPASFSLKSIGLGREYPDSSPSEVQSRQDLPARKNPPRSVTAPEGARGSSPLMYNSEEEMQAHEATSSNTGHHSRHGAAPDDGRRPNATPAYTRAGSHLNGASESSVDTRRPPTAPHPATLGQGSTDREGDGSGSNGGNRGALQKTHKRFTDAYEQGDYRGHEGSSGAAKRVMDFFRRRGRARGGDDR
ncbi:serine/threonine protein kinase [Ophiocordyceps sinensis CO18]|uniref:non-specific serine/threonine protein kinase n=1 Tax=Ophiocordyceps sinensis (strain Co18 / CGMCC 3.14243) TaxID=911162 RepID=T5ALZ8_OPHSC|nr:serine/threonine protein kinase [Ophiocordyceps sinensis CO18]